MSKQSEINVLLDCIVTLTERCLSRHKKGLEIEKELLLILAHAQDAIITNKGKRS